AVSAVAVSQDGRHIVSGSEDGTLLLWDVTGGQFRRFEGHPDRVNAVAFSPDGRYIVSSSGQVGNLTPESWKNSLRLWDAASGEFRHFGDKAYHVFTVNDLAFSPDGRYIALCCEGKDLQLWEPAALWEPRSGRGLARFKGHTEQLNAVAFSPDGQHI